MPIVFLALGFPHALSQTDLEHVTLDTPASVCSCLTARTRPQRCTVTDDEPFHTRVWDSLCRNTPQLSTGDEDRLLPGSWTKDPSLPLTFATRGLPTVPIPDTTTPPLINTTASAGSTSPLKHASAYMSTVPTDLAPNITLACTSLQG